MHSGSGDGGLIYMGRNMCDFCRVINNDAVKNKHAYCKGLGPVSI